MTPASSMLSAALRSGVLLPGAWRRPRSLLHVGFTTASQSICCGAVMGRSWTKQVSATQLRNQQTFLFSSYPPHQVVGLPSLSPTMESGSISSWHLKEGDSFTAGSTFCSVETDKATVDFECQEDGILAKILRPAGSAEIRVGDPILITVDDAAHVGAFANYHQATSSTDGLAPPSPPVASSPPSPVIPSVITTAAVASSQETTAATIVTTTTRDRIVASPLAHKLAKEMGHSISSIPGTGPGGRIIAADVKEYKPMATVAKAASSEQPAPASTTVKKATPAPTVSASIVPSSATYTDYPLSESNIRMAQELMQSKRTVPHYYLSVDVSCDALLALRTTLNVAYGSTADKKTPPPSLGVYEFMIKAAAMSMKTVPSVNASWIDTAVRVYHSVDINVVLGNGDTLHAPVITQCEQKGLSTISKDLQNAMSLLETTTTNGIPPSTLGTFTIINLGVYGVKSCAPIVRTPQSCALAIGALENRIVPTKSTSTKEIGHDDSSLYEESVMCTVTLSCDHRVVDGAVGAQWLATFRSYVENPSTLLL